MTNADFRLWRLVTEPLLREAPTQANLGRSGRVATFPTALSISPRHLTLIARHGALCVLCRVRQHLSSQRCGRNTSFITFHYQSVNLQRLRMGAFRNQQSISRVAPNRLSVVTEGMALGMS